MAEKIDFAKLNSVQRYTQWVVFRVIPGALGEQRDETIADARAFFAKLDDAATVTVRGIYDISGMCAEADFMIWWHAEEIADLQRAYNDFRRTTRLGQSSETFWSGTALHRPAEFNKSHLPSFIMGEDPGAWITVYPFVRSYDWYLMDEKERRRILAEHGRSGRDFPDVRANTVQAFAMGDYEWILAFEAPELHRNVDLMHRMRYTEARLHVREEIPFFSGRRVADIAEIIEVMP
ncbi:hydrogen peroxide-dependent heme synthase [Corynebacterium sp.]|uniref:hydrogen peroxide-dependent heme synthase n=1 Tax=Corynebacterium sp. TaxID=1720 RepID=UPI0026DC5F8F|nr:hydrogen peroxide-dependent heme synthase [Corynebacterium sp.]MDO5075656.1 chlorite dismutase family protein [Corynebacterium sp.]